MTTQHEHNKHVTKIESPMAERVITQSNEKALGIKEVIINMVTDLQQFNQRCIGARYISTKQINSKPNYIVSLTIQNIHIELNQTDQQKSYRLDLDTLTFKNKGQDCTHNEINLFQTVFQQALEDEVNNKALIKGLVK